MNWLYYLLFVFILYSFLGWVLEEVYCYFITGNFKEDGFLKGPFKPMYGIAMTILVYFYYYARLRGIPLVLTFLIIPTLVEYISGYTLRKYFNKNYWNYYNKKYNFQGLICLKFSVYWTILTFGVIYFIQPIVNMIYFNYLNIMNLIVQLILVYLLVDFISTVHLLNSRVKAYK